MSLRPFTHDPGGTDDAFSELARFWRDECVQILDELRTRVLPDRDQMPVVIFDHNAILVRPSENETETRLSRDELPEPSQASTALSRALGADNTAGDIALLFPESELLRAQVQLPQARPWTLRKALHYELARLSPIDASALYFDFKVGPPSPSSKLCEIDLRIIKRAAVDDAVAICKGAGLRPAIIGFVGDDRPADWLSLPVDRWALARLLWQRWHLAVLAAGAVLLGIVLLFAAYAREAAIGDLIASQLADERDNAARVEHLEQRTQAAIAESDFVTRQKKAPMLVAILADISRILPDNTWISQMSIADNRLRLEGSSRSASDLIALFDKAPRFFNAQFTAPLTRDEQEKVERFDLSIDIRPVHP